LSAFLPTSHVPGGGGVIECFGFFLPFLFAGLVVGGGAILPGTTWFAIQENKLNCAKTNPISRTRKPITSLLLMGFLS